MEVIVFEKDAYYKMLSEVKREVHQSIKEAKLEALKLAQKTESRSEWVTKKEAMEILKIKSSSTLQKLRDQMKIVFSQEGNSKTIIYHKQSLYDYLESNIVKL